MINQNDLTHLELKLINRIQLLETRIENLEALAVDQGERWEAAMAQYAEAMEKHLEEK